MKLKMPLKVLGNLGFLRDAVTRACWSATAKKGSAWGDFTDDERAKFYDFSQGVFDDIVNGFIDTEWENITLEFDTDQKQIRVVPLKELA